MNPDTQFRRARDGLPPTGERRRKKQSPRRGGDCAGGTETPEGGRGLCVVVYPSPENLQSKSITARLVKRRVSNLTGHLGKLGSIGSLGNVGNLRSLGSVGALAGDLTRKMDMASMTLQMVKGVVTEDQSLGDVLSGAVGDKMKELIRQKDGAESETLINTLDLLVKEVKQK